MRKLIVGGAVLVLVTGVVLVALALVLNRLIAQNRDGILQQAEATLGRAVAVDSMSASLWNLGWRLDHVRIADDPRFSDAIFLQADAVVVRADLWSLLSRQPRVSRIDLRNPEIHLIRDASGHWNYATLKPVACGGASCTARGATGIITVSTASPAPPEPTLFISRATVQDGTLVVTDRMQTPPRTIPVGKIDLTVDDLGMVTPVRLSLDVALQNDSQNVHVKGTVGPLQNSAAVPLDLSGRLGPFGPQGIGVDAVHIKATIVTDAVQASEVSGRAFGGSYSLSGRFPLASDGEAILTGQLSGMNVAQLLRINMPDADKRFAGTAQVSLDVRSVGLATKSLSGRIVADVRDGVLKDFNVVKDVLGQVTGLPTIGSLISARVKPKYGRLFTEPSTRFETLHSSFQIVEQRMRTDDLTVAATDFAVRGTGWIGFDRQADLAGSVVMSKQFTGDAVADVKEVKYLLDDSGQLAVPFRLRGKLGEAKPRPDSDYLITLLGRALSHGAAKDLLERFLGTKDRPSTPAPGQSGNPIEQRLRDLLGR